jgi:hypothetical protein
VPDEASFLKVKGMTRRVVFGARGSCDCAQDDVVAAVILHEVAGITRANPAFCARDDGIAAVILRAVAGSPPANGASSATATL